MSKCILHLLPRNKTVISTKKRMCNRYDTHPLCSWWGQPRGFWQEARSIRTHESGISATLCFVSVVWLSATTISAIYGEPVLSLLSKGFNAILNMVFFCLKNTISSKKIIFSFWINRYPFICMRFPSITCMFQLLLDIQESLTIQYIHLIVGSGATFHNEKLPAPSGLSMIQQTAYSYP